MIMKKIRTEDWALCGKMKLCNEKWKTDAFYKKLNSRTLKILTKSEQKLILRKLYVQIEHKKAKQHFPKLPKLAV